MGLDRLRPAIEPGRKHLVGVIVQTAVADLDDGARLRRKLSRVASAS